MHESDLKLINYILTAQDVACVLNNLVYDKILFANNRLDIILCVWSTAHVIFLLQVLI